MNTQELLDKIVEGHQRFYTQNPNGELTPMFIVEVEEELRVISVFFSNEYEKRAICQNMRLMFDELGVERYVFFSESWASSYKNEKDWDGKMMPSQDPNRVEIIMTVAADRSGLKIGNTLEMVRGESGGIIRLVPWGLEGQILAGRFSEILD
jgi:hypothetical protein